MELARVADLWEENQECLKQRLGESGSSRFGARWVLMSQVPAPRFNHVSKVRVSPEAVDDLIGECRAFYRQNGLPCSCLMTTPATEPRDLAIRLYRMGFTSESNPVMVHDGSALPVPPPAVRVEPVGRDQAALVFQLIRQVFFPEAIGYAAQHLRRGVDVCFDIGALNYVAWLGHTPVGAGTLFCHGGAGGIYNMCTLPQYQHQGVATAVLAACMADAKRLRCELVGLTPTAQGRPLYERTGFREVYQERYFVERYHG